MNSILEFIYELFLRIWSVLYHLSWNFSFPSNDGTGHTVTFTVNYGALLVGASIIALLISVVWRGAQK